MECPYCGSENVYCHKRGYSWTLGCLTCFVLSIFGLLLGLIGSDKLVFHCNDCGESWKF